MIAAGHKINALDLPAEGTIRAQKKNAASDSADTASENRGTMVDGRRLELPTSALRTRRSPN
jgi:hypothetical protein